MLQTAEDQRIQGAQTKSRLTHDLVAHYGHGRDPGAHGRIAELLIEAGFEGDSQELDLLLKVIHSRMMSGSGSQRGNLSGIEIYLSMMKQRGAGLPYYGTGLKQRATNPNRGLGRHRE